jgi:hypothetical protein
VDPLRPISASTWIRTARPFEAKRDPIDRWDGVGGSASVLAPNAGLVRPSDVPSAPWTLFVYLNADNDLAPFAAEDLKEMERVGSLPGKLNVIALVDGAGTQIDLGDFAHRIATEFPTGPLKEAAQRLFCVILHGAHPETADVQGYGNGHVWGLSIYGPRGGVGIDPLYEHPNAPWHGSKWIDFLRSRERPIPGFAIPAWAVPEVGRDLPWARIPWATNAKVHGDVPMTVRHIVSNAGASISLVGFVQSGAQPELFVSRNDAERSLEIRVRKTDAGTGLDQTYASVVDLPVPEGDRDTWRVRVIHAESGIELGNAYWRRGAGNLLSEIL